MTKEHRVVLLALFFSFLFFSLFFFSAKKRTCVVVSRSHLLRRGGTSECM